MWSWINGVPTYTGSITVLGAQQVSSLGVGQANTTAGSIIASGSIFCGSGNSFVFGNRSQIMAPADGQMTASNQANTAGVGFDFGTDGVLAVRDRALTGTGRITFPGANGQVFNEVQQLTELTTIAAAATTDTTIQMPAGAVILGVSTRVTVVIPTAATMTIGDSGSAARFNTGASMSVAANTTDPGTKAGAYYNASALSIRITPNATPAANTGRVRVTIYYFTITPPTS